MTCLPVGRESDDGFVDGCGLSSVQHLLAVVYFLLGGSLFGAFGGSGGSTESPSMLALTQGDISQASTRPEALIEFCLPEVVSMSNDLGC